MTQQPHLSVAISCACFFERCVLGSIVHHTDVDTEQRLLRLPGQGGGTHVSCCPCKNHVTRTCLEVEGLLLLSIHQSASVAPCCYSRTSTHRPLHPWESLCG